MRNSFSSPALLACATLLGLLPVPALAQTEGTAAWSFLTTGQINSSPALAADGTLYVGNEAAVATQSRLYAIRPDGSLKWQFSGATDWISSTPAVGSDGTIYVGSWDGKLYAIDPATGAAKWAYAADGFIASSPALAADGTIYIGSGDRTLHAVNPDGTRKWTYPVADWVDSAPAIGGDGTIYFGSYDNNLYALRSDGTLRWQFDSGDNVTSSPAIGSDGTVYIGSSNGKLYALDGATGAKRWEYATGSGVVASPAIGATGRVYLGSLDGYFYALDGATGALLWRTNMDAEILSTAALRADGSVVFGAGTSLYALNADGSLKWRLAADDYVDSSPLIAPDGTLYVGSADKRLYAVRGNGQALAADAPWPMFRQDNYRRGRVAATAPSVTTPVSTQIATTGNTVSLSVSANGSEPLAYQWRKNGVALAGATSPTLTLASVSANDAASYTVAVTNTGGTTISAAVTLVVNPVVIAQPAGIGADAAGNLVVTDPSTNVVHAITSAGVVSTLAGAAGQSGTTDGTGAAARFNQPRGLAYSGGTARIADSGNGAIRSVTSAGAVTTLATSLNGPQAVAQDAAGDFYVADTLNHLVRKVTASGVVTTLAGAAGQSGTTDGTGAAARFNSPSGIAVAPDGTLYVADTTNNTLRKVTPAGVVSTFAGLAGVSGANDGIGAAALFNRPTGLATDSAGNLYVADTGNSTLRKVTPAGLVTTLAGLATIAGIQDGTGLGAYFNQPQGLTVDGAGNVYVADTGNAAVRKITAAGLVSTLNLSVASTPAPAPTPTPTPSPAPAGGGGGGGGGAPTPLAALAFVALLGARALRRL